MEFYSDRIGNELGKTYSTVVVNPYFEKRLKNFDSSLKLLFDQLKKKWVILEWAPDNSGWNIIYTAEDDFGNAMPLGEHVFEHLHDMRRKYALRFQDPNAYFDSLIAESERQKAEIERKSSEAHKTQLLDDVNDWRRANRELKNLPTSDVTAGYNKIKPTTKGVIYG